MVTRLTRTSDSHRCPSWLSKSRLVTLFTTPSRTLPRFSLRMEILRRGHSCLGFKLSGTVSTSEDASYADRARCYKITDISMLASENGGGAEDPFYSEARMKKTVCLAVALAALSWTIATGQAFAQERTNTGKGDRFGGRYRGCSC